MGKRTLAVDALANMRATARDPAEAAAEADTELPPMKKKCVRAKAIAKSKATAEATAAGEGTATAKAKAKAKAKAQEVEEEPSAKGKAKEEHEEQGGAEEDAEDDEENVEEGKATAKAKAQGKAKAKGEERQKGNACDLDALPTAIDYTKVTPEQKHVWTKACKAPQGNQSFVPEERGKERGRG